MIANPKEAFRCAPAAQSRTRLARVLAASLLCALSAGVSFAQRPLTGRIIVRNVAAIMSAKVNSPKRNTPPARSSDSATVCSAASTTRDFLCASSPIAPYLSRR